MTILFSSLLKAKLKFALKTVNFRVAGKYSPPDCYKFEIQVNMKFLNFESEYINRLNTHI